MLPLFVTVEAGDGEDVSVVLGAMLKLSKKLDIGVEARINGKLCIVSPHCTPESALAQYNSPIWPFRQDVGNSNQ